MKNLIYLLFAVLLCSCSSESLETAEAQNRVAEMQNSRFGDTLPQNSDNEYDYAGKIHNDILTAYYGGAFFPSTIAEIAQIVDSLANLHPDFTAIKGSSYVPVSVTRVEYLLADRDSTMARVLGSSGLSLHAKQFLTGFMEDLDDLIADDEDYDSIHSFITTLETAIISDSLLSFNEKEVLFTTTSIARYTVYMKRKRPKKNQDPDWDWLTANIMGGTDGAVTGTAEAISRAVVTGIADNK